MRPAPGLALLGCLWLAGCSATPPAEPPPSDIPEQPPAVAAPAPLRPFPADSFYDLLVAEVAVRRGDYDIALGNYLQQAQITRDAEVAARATRLAQFLRAEQPALEAALLWAELAPEDVEAQFTVASLLARNERPLEAMPPMVKVLDAGAKANFATIAASASQQPEEVQRQLLQNFEALLAERPDNIELKTGKALLLQQIGEREAALGLIREVLAQAPEETHAIIIEARLLQELERDSEAFTRLEQVVEQNPYNRRLRLQYARLLTETDLPRAREQFEVLLQQSPDDPDLVLSLALVSRESGALDDAERYFNQLLELGHHTGEAHYYLGQLAEQRADRETALQHYEQIPPSEEFLPAIARAIELRLAAGDLPGVRRHLGSLRRHYPQHAVRLYLLESEILMQRKQFESGNQLLTEALKHYPQQPNLLYARSMFSERRRDVPLLEKDLRAILARDPDSATALNALGYVLANLTDRIEEAYQLIRRAHELKPEDPAILDSMGWVEYRRGNLELALDYLERAYADFPDEEVAVHLGEVLYHLGHRDRARDVLLDALQKDPNSDLVRAAIKRFVEDNGDH
jgi:tetratricopeptide (TPR) repeat protein